MVLEKVRGWLSTSKNSPMQTNQQRESIRERIAVYAPEKISLVTVANLRCCQVSHGNWKTAKKWTSLGIYLRASKCRKFPLQKVKNPKKKSKSFSLNVFLRMKCFSFLLTKEPLDVIGAVQGMEVYCDIHSTGFGNWKICRMVSAADPKAKFKFSLKY